MAADHFRNFAGNALFAQSTGYSIIKEENTEDYNYELCDIATIKTENEQSVEQDISAEQIYRCPSSEYTLQLLNDTNDCTSVCDNRVDYQLRSKFQNDLSSHDDFQSPYILRNTPFKMPSVIKQTDSKRPQLECNSAFKPIFHRHSNISDRDTVRTYNNKEHLEYSSAFKPVYHSTQNEMDVVANEIDIGQQKFKHNSAFKPVFNSRLHPVSEPPIRTSNGRQYLGCSSAFTPIRHSTQNNSDQIAGIDYKRIRLNETIPSSNYQGDNVDNCALVQPVNQNISQNSTVSNNEIAALLMRQIEAIETTNKLLKEIILTKYSVSNKENKSM